MQAASGAVRETTVPMKDAATAAKATTQQLLEITKATADKISAFQVKLVRPSQRLNESSRRYSPFGRNKPPSCAEPMQNWSVLSARLAEI
jgi:hypothetical protein